MSRLENRKGHERTEKKEWNDLEVVVFDDDISRIALLQRNLKESGVKTVDRISHAINLEGAIAMLKAVIGKKRRAPDLIFLDEMMPENDDPKTYGPQAKQFLLVFKALQRKHPVLKKTRIIMFTNAANAHDSRDEWEQALKNHIPTPIIAFIDPDSHPYSRDPQDALKDIRETLAQQGLIT